MLEKVLSYKKRASESLKNQNQINYDVGHLLLWNATEMKNMMPHTAAQLLKEFKSIHW